MNRVQLHDQGLTSATRENPPASGPARCLRRALVALSAAALLAGCTIARESSPARTATEQLLISTAAERAADRLDLRLEPGTAVYVDATWFEATDARYAIGTIRDRLLRRGMRLVPERDQADAVVEVRSGALSVDESQTLLGTPGMDVPIPLAGDFAVPEIALYSVRERFGVARFAATSYRTADGSLIDAAPELVGSSRVSHRTVLFFFSWTSTDLPGENGRDLPEPRQGGRR